MRITCPHCGARDRREFTYMGAALPRPAADALPEAWDDYLHNRDNPAGMTRELWYHEMGCGAWLMVTRDTVSHEIHAVALASDGVQGSAEAAP
jgi:heterotetrameric sarcosine oxidase delta subunit